MNKTHMTKILMTLTLATTIFSCSNKSSDSQYQSLGLINSKIISDRPQNTKQVVALIKLEGKALFETLNPEAGITEVAQEEKQRILEEQKVAWEKVLKESPKAKLLYSYRFVLNALAVVVPVEDFGKLGQVGGVSDAQKETQFERPQFDRDSLNKSKYNLDFTSVDFIGATSVHEELSVKGKGIKVGVIDTGIDFTHSALGGLGNAQEFRDMNPNEPSTSFPNAKVKGGIDLVGTNYSPGHVITDYQVPRPDSNPIDEGGHGTHVAGTVAGIGDGINTYSGVAPEADLYAIKVFGAKGSTSDTVVIAALEYSADPNGDLNTDDKLDIVNLSLGGSYGKPYVHYSEAVKNLTKGGVLTVAAAGNSGHNPYIVGSPSTSKDALSVAASIDGMDHNWKFDSVEFNLNDEQVLTKVVEGTISRPVAQSKEVQGKIVFAGVAAQDFSDELKKQIEGNIALIDRGEVSFIDKLKRASDAGATGVIVANNNGDAPFRMGGEGKVNIPAIMISLSLGNAIKDSMKLGDVLVNFGSEAKIEEPELIDTLTSFTSQGPRSLDSLLKPEISAPGFNIISASMGTGSEGVALNGTSMASPHMAGVMALLKEKFPTLDILELKDLVMNNSKTISNTKKLEYSVTEQGAGRVQTYKTATANTLVRPAALSLGETSLIKKKVIARDITIKNISNEAMTYTFEATNSFRLTTKLPDSFTLNTGEKKTVTVIFTLTNDGERSAVKTFEGRVFVKANDLLVGNIPVLAVVKVLSEIENSQLNLYATSNQDDDGALGIIALKNKSVNNGDALFYNFIAADGRKEVNQRDFAVASRTCDLHTVGYRLEHNEGKTWIKFGFKLYNPVSLWQGCELNVQIDTNNDGIADQELGGLNTDNLSGLSDAVPAGQYSVLLDANKAREIRKNYEMLAAQTGKKPLEDVNYLPAILDLRPMLAYTHSTVASMEADISLLATLPNKVINVKMATIGEGGVESDDYLGKDWHKISLTEGEQGFVSLKDIKDLKGREQRNVNLTKGNGNHDLLILYPHNKSVGINGLSLDNQGALIKPTYQQ